jgi:CheY-like chemotaxis protein
MAKKQILCIDDDVAGLAIRKMMLEAEGYEVFTAANGAEGLESIERRNIDAVILDYQMPQMNGAEVARSIREKWPDLPIVMLSGFPDDVPESALHLVNAFVTKGDGPERLLLLLNRSLKGPFTGRITILNVDDNDEHRYAITRVLKSAGFHVFEAKTGKEALDLVSHRPSLVILDINLPDMLGFDVCRRLKSSDATRNIPVIHMSATYPRQAAGRESIESGAERFVEHPQDLFTVVQVVQEELRKYGSI